MLDMMEDGGTRSKDVFVGGPSEGGKGKRSDGRRESKDESCWGGGTDVRNSIFVFRVPWNLKFDIFRAVRTA